MMIGPPVHLPRLLAAPTRADADDAAAGTSTSDAPADAAVICALPLWRVQWVRQGGCTPSQLLTHIHLCSASFIFHGICRRM